MRKKGFTLIELMIVIAIIAILAVIAVPRLLESQKSANESSAIGQLKGILNAQAVYRQRGYTRDTTTGLALFGTFGQLAGRELFTAWTTGSVTPTTATTSGSGSVSGYKSGYLFEIDGDGGARGVGTISPAWTNFFVVARPNTLDNGSRSFLLGTDQLVHYTVLTSNTDTPAVSITDPTID